MPIRLQVGERDDPTRPSYRYEFDGDRSTLTLGRRGGVDVLLPHPRVSLVHARLERSGTSYVVVDEGSRHGTMLNGVRLRPGARASVKAGDTIGIADYVIEIGVYLTELDGPGDNSRLIARRMVRDVLERLGPMEAQPRLEGEGIALVLPDMNRTYILGHAPDGAPALDAIDMWREHVALERDELGVTVRPLGAGANIRVDGARVDGPISLRDGSQVALGDRALRFVDPSEAYLRKLEAVPEALPSMTMKPLPKRQWVPIALGIVAIVLGVAGLVWVLRW